MKNVIKKTCAIVMMTAVLFTAVAPKSVLASCAHPHPPVTGTVEELDSVRTHIVNGKTCNIKVYKQYRVYKCGNCGTIFNKVVIGGREEHSSSH